MAAEQRDDIDIFHFFCETLKQTLTRIVENLEDDSNPEILQPTTMLRDMFQEPSSDDNDDVNFFQFKQSVEATGSYPMYPLYQTFCRNLYKYIQSNVPPQNLTASNMQTGFTTTSLDFPDVFKDCVKKLRSMFCFSGSGEVSMYFNDLKSVEGNAFRTNVELVLTDLLHSLRNQDILILHGLNRTQGSIDTLAPHIHALWKAFQYQHHPKSKLTVGARALAKHCHRSSEQFWGVCSGSEDAKNKHALEILRKIFLDCSWINIHMLPHDVCVLEVRCNHGYGLRWSHDGTVFRGFLEPQMENGHEVGWKH